MLPVHQQLKIYFAVTAASCTKSLCHCLNLLIFKSNLIILVTVLMTVSPFSGPFLFEYDFCVSCAQLRWNSISEMYTSDKLTYLTLASKLYV